METMELLGNIPGISGGASLIVLAITIFVICALWGSNVVDFFCKIIAVIFVGGLSGIVCGALGCVLLHFFGLGTLGFCIGFVVGAFIYVIKWCR